MQVGTDPADAERQKEQPMSTTDPGWYRDPTGRYADRYWDGQQWTDQVNSGGANAVDEPPSDMKSVPPAPGTASVTARTTAPIQVTQQTSRSSFGAVIAVVLAIIAVVVLVVVLVNQSGDDDSTPTTEPVATTEAPPSDG
jgi:hypothetical protein